MTKSTARRAQQREARLNRVFGALSDGTRRRLLARLERSSATITELAEPFAMSLPAVSEHVRVLESAGLIRRSIDGRVHHCTLDAAPLEEAQRWLAHYRVFWSETLDSLAAYAEQKGRP